MIESNTLSNWNNRGTKICTIEDPEIEFTARFIAHKFYQLSQPNSVSCITVDLGWKIIKKDHGHNLVDPQLTQLAENLKLIRKVKKHICMFGSLIVCIFFYVHNMFPSIGDVVLDIQGIDIKRF